MQIPDIKIEGQIKTISEYLFFDQFQDTASFPRFEQCFQPLFNIINIFKLKINLSFIFFLII